MSVSWLLAGIGLLVAWGLYRAIIGVVLPPSHMPKNIPTIPFYYSLLPLFRDVDQESLFREYLEGPLVERGAVKIYFGGQWNVLVTRPALMAQVLKRDGDFPKAGNHIKIPRSVLAQYTGENIISAAGETWKYFASLVRPGLQADVDPSIVVRNTQSLIEVFRREQDTKGRVDVQDHIQAYAIANICDSLLGFSFDALENPDHPLLKFQREIKPKIFNPIYLSFPVLDNFYIPSREEAKRLVTRFKDEFATLFMQGHDEHRCEPNSSNLGCRLISAHKEGELSEYHFQQNALIAFIAGHENTMILTLSNLFTLAERPELQEQVREEVMRLPPADRARPEALATLPLLTSVILETLRFYPPLSQIMNKRTAADTVLNEDGYDDNVSYEGSSEGIPLRAGTYMGYNGYGTNRDRTFWGPDADTFRPSRWGNSVDEANQLLRRATSKAAFITFHGGKRACLGQKWAMAAHRVSMSLLLTSLRWQLDPDWDRKMTPAGPLMPRKLRLQFEQIKAQ